jgi:two-component system, LytTR family, sensor kinase
MRYGKGLPVISTARRLPMLTTLCLLMWCRISAHSQTTDSLKQVLLKMAFDTNKVNTLNELCRAYRTSAPDSARKYGEASLALALELNDYKGIATALNSIGAVYFFSDDYQTARSYQNRSLEYAWQYQFPTQQANALNSLALINQYEGDFVQAIEAYMQAMAIEETLENKKGIVKILANMALLYKSTGDYENSLVYAKRALMLNGKLPQSEKAQASIVNTIGLVYVRQKKFNEALPYLQANLAIGRKLKDQSIIPNALNNIAYCYLNMGTDLLLSAPFLEEASTFLPTLTSQQTRILIMLNLGELRAYQHQDDEAKRLLEESLSLAQSIHAKERILDCYRTLAEVNYKWGNYRNAYQYSQRAGFLSDSLKNAEVFDKMARIQKGYELSRKQSQIDQLSKVAQIEKLKSEKQDDLIYFLTGALVLVVLIAIITYLSFRTKNKLYHLLENKNQQIQRLNLSLEIRALRSQMDPHFVFNALNGLQHFLAFGNKEKSIGYLSKVARFIRLTLQHASQDWIKISEEIEILKLYLEVEQYRFPGKFNFEFKLDASVKNERIPFLVIQPYVENAVLHGLLPRKEDGMIVISIAREEERLNITIEDNGIGRKAAVQDIDPMFTSMGSGLVRSRLQKLSQQLDAVLTEKTEDLMDINGMATGTRCTLVFALHHQTHAALNPHN